MAHTPLVIAHRGASQAAPENTLAAIRKALELGADMLALEVQKTKDNVPVVLADVNLDRTTNGSGRVVRMNLDELKDLDAGSWFGSQFSSERIPTLQAALEEIGKKARVFLSLPETRAGTPWATELAKVLKSRSAAAKDVLAFSDSDSIKQFRDTAPGFAYSLLLGERVDGWMYLEKAEKLGLKVLRPYRTQVDSVMVGEARQKGIAVYAYFANEEADLRSLVDLRVDGIVTGRPERLKAILGSAQA